MATIQKYADIYKKRVNSKNTRQTSDSNYSYGNIRIKDTEEDRSSPLKRSNNSQSSVSPNRGGYNSYS